MTDSTKIQRALDQVSGTKAAGRSLDSRVHPFPASMPISLATHLLEQLSDRNARILDPMMGSGTTLIAAKKLGRSAVGFDRDPFATLLSRVSITNFRTSLLESLSERVIARACKVAGRRSFRLRQLRSSLNIEDQGFLRYWFPPTSQKQLFALSAAIEEERGLQRAFAQIVFSSLIIAKTSGASYAMDISRSRPHKSPDKPVVFPFDAWSSRFRRTMTRLPFRDSAQSHGKIRVRTGDARSLPIEDASIDVILTSPPYLNAIDYLRSHKFSLIWMGYDLEDLRELRGTMIGTERGLAGLDGLPEAAEKNLARQIAENRRQAQIRQYLSDLNKSLREMARVLRPRGLVILVLGPTLIQKRRSDAFSVVSTLALEYGLQPMASTVRQIVSVRRSLPTPSSVSGGNALASRMRREVIMVLQKPK